MVIDGSDWPGYTRSAQQGHSIRGCDVAIIRRLVELFAFLVYRRAWWMIPVVAGLLMVGLLLIVAEATPLGPIYLLIDLSIDALPS